MASNQQTVDWRDISPDGKRPELPAAWLDNTFEVRGDLLKVSGGHLDITGTPIITDGYYEVADQAAKDEALAHMHEYIPDMRSDGSTVKDVEIIPSKDGYQLPHFPVEKLPEYLETGGMKIKPSDSNRDFGTGAIRGEDGGRGKPSLLPFDALVELSRVFEAGAKKYAARNWEHGIPLSSYIDSAMRHLQKFLRGETDEPHAAQFAWNALCLLQTLMWIQEGKLPSELNDLPNVPLDERNSTK